MRGAAGDPKFSLASGLRYGGLFGVVDFWYVRGIGGFRVWRFRTCMYVFCLQGGVPGRSHRPGSCCRLLACCAASNSLIAERWLDGPTVLAAAMICSR
ncbi:hypothetical protein AB0M54_04940 [Actinoplanes sp. NPDC051470]|uniref:hypothetical protein n=1 Tax=Actinoplanes sp. NPDC051470 TaxID=3157224 RepID=UPI00342B88AE